MKVAKITVIQTHNIEITEEDLVDEYDNFDSFEDLRATIESSPVDWVDMEEPDRVEVKMEIVEE